MKVQNILEEKGADAVSIQEDVAIRDAVSVLGQRNIGAVLVKNAGGDVTGILSERDIVRHLKDHGQAVLGERVVVCMTPDPYTCDPEATIDEVMTEMTVRRIRHMPVVKDGALKGIVSIGDVVKRKIEQAEQEAEELKAYIAS